MARNVFKLFNKVGEIFEIYVSEMASKAFKLSTTFGEMFEIYMFEMNRNVFKLSTGENFEIYIFEMARNEFKLSKFPDNSTIFHKIFETFSVFLQYNSKPQVNGN